jgi:hypothetical protein
LIGIGSDFVFGLISDILPPNVFEHVMKAAPVIMRVKDEGPGALWEYIKEEADYQEHGGKTFILPKNYSVDGDFPDVRVNEWASARITYSIELEYDYLGYFVDVKTRPCVMKLVVPNILGGPSFAGKGGKWLSESSKTEKNGAIRWLSAVGQKHKLQRQ